MTSALGPWGASEYPFRQGEETGFDRETRHRLVQEFAVSYYNGTLKPNLAEKNSMTGREIEYLMDGPQFEKIKRTEMWSYSSAVGTGYQYRVVYKDKRFSNLERLMQMHSGAEPAPDGDSSGVEQRIYEMILVLLKEGRLPKTFRIQSPKEVQEAKIAAMLEEFGKTLDDLGKRVRKMEEQLSAQDNPSVNENPSPPPQNVG